MAISWTRICPPFRSTWFRLLVVSDVHLLSLLSLVLFCTRSLCLCDIGFVLLSESQCIVISACPSHVELSTHMHQSRIPESPTNNHSLRIYNWFLVHPETSSASESFESSSEQKIRKLNLTHF